MPEPENFLKAIAEQFTKTWTEIGSGAARGWLNLSETVSPIAASNLEPSATRINNPWIELNHFYWTLIYENTLGSLVQMPLLGANRGLNTKLLQTFDAWAKLYPASIDYQIVLAEIQLRALEEMLRSAFLLEKSGAVQDWSQLQQLWSHTVDRVFEEAFSAEANLKIRGQLLNAVNDYKLRQQEVMEMWLKAMNLPLRSEVDEVHKNIYELRKELKHLKKTVEKSETHYERMFDKSNSRSQNGLLPLDQES